jgi:hypothetical protein
MNTFLLQKYLESVEFERKLNYRLERLQLAETNPIERINIIAEATDDIFTFIDLFGVVYEPRYQSQPDIPMFLFPHQRDIIYKLLDAETEKHDFLIEKTRDMMVTWTIIWYILWRWWSQNKWYCRMGSRKEDEVDNNTPQSLFGKLRYAFYSLPKWARPVNFRKSEHDLHMKLINPDRQSYIDGESANPDFGRGGRFSMIFMDELFSWKFARESWRACGDSTPCRIGVSTAKPTSFARNLRNAFEANHQLMTLDWHQHPFKDEEWYKKEVERRKNDPLAVEGELEISYISDPQLSYYPEVLSCPITDFDYQPNLPLYVGCDFGVQDKTAFVWFQKDRQNFYCLDGFEKNHKPLYWYLPFLKPGFDFDKQSEYTVINKTTKEQYTLKKSDYLQNELDLIKRVNSWKQPVGYFGEVAHRQHMIKSNTSIVSELAGFGINLRINDLAVAHSVRRENTKRMLKTTSFSSRYGALDVYDALANSHFPKSNGNTVNPKDQPVHDEWADIRSAVENFACNMNFEQQGGIRSFTYHNI